MLRKSKKHNITLAKIVLVFVSVSITAVAKLNIEFFLGEGPPLIFFFPTVILCGYVGGFWAGAAATVLSGLLADFFFLKPIFHIGPTSGNDQFRLVLFVGISLAISYLFEHLHARKFQIELFNDELQQQKRELEIKSELLEKSNEELDRFASIAAHDLQEPIRTVAMLLNLIRRREEASLSSESREDLQTVLDSTSRMAGLVTALLQFSKAGCEPIREEATDCEAELEFVLADLGSLIERNGASISYKSLPVLPAHPTLVRGLFQNLITNAIKYRGPAAPKIEIDCVESGHQWILSVRDNGIGISSEYQERVFDAFQRLHGREIPGTGLGLTTSRKIVERWGGKIWLESTPGSGSTFYFSIPTLKGNPNGVVG